MKKIIVLLSLLTLISHAGFAQTDLLEIFSDSACYKIVQCKVDQASDGRYVKNIIFSFPDGSLLAEAYLESKAFRNGDKISVGYLSIDSSDGTNFGFNAKDLKSMSKDLVKQLSIILRREKITTKY
ncbi:MAG: hypothetical protein WC606_01320 [Candidatus Absconditabacterales bacterium]|jgi:hypothetical protein